MVLVAALAFGAGLARGRYRLRKDPPQDLEPFYNTPAREADAARRRQRFIP